MRSHYNTTVGYLWGSRSSGVLSKSFLVFLLVFDQLDVVSYEEVVQLPAFKRKTLVLIGNGITPHSASSNVKSMNPYNSVLNNQVKSQKKTYTILFTPTLAIGILKYRNHTFKLQVDISALKSFHGE